MRLHVRGGVHAVLAIIVSLGALVQVKLFASAQGRGDSQRTVMTAEWYTFTSPDGDFTLDFPRKPDHEKDAQGPVTAR